MAHPSNLAAEVAHALIGLYGIPERLISDPADVLIGTILSQNTNSANSRRAYDNLIRRFGSLEEVAKAGREEVADAIRSAGLADQKSATVIRALKWMNDAFGGFRLDALCNLETDEAMRQLTSVKRIGVKTAAVVLMFGCGKDLCPVDTHVHRLAKRLGLVPPTSSRDATFETMRIQVPPGEGYGLHMNLIRFGRQRCTARSPDCHGCPLAESCLYDCESMSLLLPGT